MHRWNDCFTPDEFDALAARRRVGPSDAGDETAWNDLGTLVQRLMLAERRLPVGRQIASRHRVCEVFNYWDQQHPPADVAECMGNWTELGVPVRSYNAVEAEDYLREHFGGDVLAAFRYAHHPAMQSDLFRLARLLRDGGLYVDADDICRGAFSPPTFQAGAAVMPLSVCRACDRSTQPLAGDPAAGMAWYYLGNAPLFSLPGHPLVERTLERAVATVTMRRMRGELCQIHRDTGPVCLSMAALDHVMERFFAGRPCDLSVSPDWQFIEQSRPLAYKGTERNWRSNAVIYPPSVGIPTAPETAARIDLARSSL